MHLFASLLDWVISLGRDRIWWKVLTDKYDIEEFRWITKWIMDRMGEFTRACWDKPSSICILKWALVNV